MWMSTLCLRLFSYSMKVPDDLPCQRAGSSKEICRGRIGEAEVALLCLGGWLVGIFRQ